MRALVIGGTGFIGLATVDALLAAGLDVRVSRRPRSITALVRKREVELVPAAFDDHESLVAAMRGCDVVFMCAGHYPRYSIDRDGAIEQGVAGVRAVCRAALTADVGRLVFTSSTGALALAPPGRAADEDDIPEAMPTESVYRAVKWAMEREAEAWASRGLPVTTILPGGCFGPGDLRLGTGGILVGAVRGLLPFYVEGIVPVVDVADVAFAHVAAALHAAPRARYCVAGRAVLVSELLSRVTARHGGAIPPVVEPEEAIALADAAEREAAPKKARVPVPRELVDVVIAGQRVSSSRAREDLGVRFRPLEDTLERAHAFFVSVGYLPRAAERKPEAT